MEKRKDIRSRKECYGRTVGWMPFDGPFAIVDRENPYCELFAKMYTSYLEEFRDGKRGIKELRK